VNVLVDTSVWSLALRRRDASSGEAAELGELIWEQRVRMIGPVRQELLSGIRDVERFRLLREHLRAFPDIPLETDDYERAAEFLNTCRAKGIQGSNTDFLLCAVSERRDLALFTTDADFEQYTRHIPLRLHKAGGRRS
jgi:hypothetical protein